MELLWNYLFPNATSAMNVDVQVVSTPDDKTKDDRPAQPSVGLLFYYELYSGDSNVYPKIYLPVRSVRLLRGVENLTHHSIQHLLSK
jgi:hypothetical protein